MMSLNYRTLLAERIIETLEAFNLLKLEDRRTFNEVLVTRWFVEFIELREKSIHEFRHPTIAIRFLRPIEAHEQYAGRERVGY